jgi:hypothetical protein
MPDGSACLCLGYTGEVAWRCAMGTQFHPDDMRPPGLVRMERLNCHMQPTRSSEKAGREAPPDRRAGDVPAEQTTKSCSDDTYPLTWYPSGYSRVFPLHNRSVNDDCHMTSILIAGLGLCKMRGIHAHE